MTKEKGYMLAFEISTNECPVELMALLRHYAEQFANDLIIQGCTANLSLDSERVEDAATPDNDNYDGADPLLWSGW